MLYARVIGVPAPQGSKSFKGMIKSKATGRMIPRLLESSKKVAPWRDDVARAMVEANKAAPQHFAGAVRLTLQFIMPRTTAEPKGWTRHHTRAPDLSKLIRATEDAITTAGVWADDSRVVELTAVKVTAEPGEASGCVIIIEALPEKERPDDKAKAAAGRSKAGRGSGASRSRSAGRTGGATTGTGAEYFA